MTRTQRNRDGGDAAKLPRPAPAGERRWGLRAAGVAASLVAAPIIRKQGGGILARCKAEWPAIVGAEWSGLTWPVALGRDGALKVHVAAAVALDLQHRAPLLIERINLFFGRAIAARLTLVQGPLPLPPPPRPQPPRALAAAAAAALDAQLGAVADPELRAALARLGQVVIGGPGRSDGE